MNREAKIQECQRYMSAAEKLRLGIIEWLNELGYQTEPDNDIEECILDEASPCHADYYASKISEAAIDAEVLEQFDRFAAILYRNMQIKGKVLTELLTAPKCETHCDWPDCTLVGCKAEN